MEGVKSQCHSADVKETDGKTYCVVCGHECATTMGEDAQKPNGEGEGQPTGATAPEAETAAPAAGDAGQQEAPADQGGAQDGDAGDGNAAGTSGQDAAPGEGQGEAPAGEGAGEGQA